MNKQIKTHVHVCYNYRHDVHVHVCYNYRHDVHVHVLMFL